MCIFAPFFKLIIIERMKKQILFLIPCAIGVLSLISCGGKGASEQSESAAAVAQSTGAIMSAPDGSIVYVNIDSLMQNYQMTIDLSNELEEKMQKLSAELTNRERRFQANVNDFNNKAQRGLETRARLAEMEQQLAVEQQNLMQLSEQYRMEMAEEQMVMQRKILQSIMDYLQEYNKDKRYKYILANSFGSNILFADPSLDITAPVLEGINAQYKR